MPTFSRTLQLALAGALVFPAAGFVFAQQPIVPQNPGAQPPGAPAQPRFGRPDDRGGRFEDRDRFDRRGRVDRDDLRGGRDRLLRSSVIIGAPVFLSGGTSFGTVQDVVIGPNGCVDYAVVSYQNGLIPIPWGLGNFDLGRRAFAIDVDQVRIRELPRFRQFSELENGQFRQRVDTFFRGTPGHGEFRDQGRGVIGGRNMPQPGTQGRQVAPGTRPGAGAQPAPGSENRPGSPGAGQPGRGTNQPQRPPAGKSQP